MADHEAERQRLLGVAWADVHQLRAEVDAVRRVCAEREAELLEIKGPCSTRACSLHRAHRGPCDIDGDTTEEGR